MTWIILALRNAWGFIARYPAASACAILAAISLWLWVSRANIQERYTADIAEWQAKSKAAAAATAKATADAKTASKEAQQTYEELTETSDSLDAYIRANRVQQCPAAKAIAASNRASGLPEVTAPETIVAVDESDLKACDGAWVYAQSAYEWGQSLADKGLAK